jgi:hypothetical protein
MEVMSRGQASSELEAAILNYVMREDSSPLLYVCASYACLAFFEWISTV